MRECERDKHKEREGDEMGKERGIRVERERVEEEWYNIHGGRLLDTGGGEEEERIEISVMIVCSITSVARRRCVSMPTILQATAVVRQWLDCSPPTVTTTSHPLAPAAAR